MERDLLAGIGGLARHTSLTGLAALGWVAGFPRLVPLAGATALRHFFGLSSTSDALKYTGMISLWCY